MRSDAAALPVAIVGGGFSGSMTALHLARRGVPVLLVERRERLGRGLAYSTRDPAHVLNVPSARMSAWPDVPEDFQRWLGDDGTAFAERRAFGRYVGEQLDGEQGIEAVHGTCVGAARVGEEWVLRLDDGSERIASGLVLALGNQPPAPDAFGSDLPTSLFVNDPWTAEAAEAVARMAADGGDVLLLGTGLTMVDSALSLVEYGHTGRIVALSRRGLIPRVHAAHEPAPVALCQLPLGSVLAMALWLRRRSAEVGFRAAVDSLRPHTRAVWQSWSVAEQSRFLRHARPWWDVHRHRVAPEVGRQVMALVAGGQLEVMAGRLRSLQPSGDALIVRRGGCEVQRRFSLVINCTGPLADMGRTSSPLLQQLLTDGAITLDPHRLGLRVNDQARAGDRLWAVGPLTKGMYWEMVAVPDIRGQVAEVAADVAGELGVR